MSWGRKRKVLDLAESLARRYFQRFQLRHVLKMFKWMTSCFILWHSWNTVTNTINVHLIMNTMLVVIRESAIKSSQVLNGLFYIEYNILEL